MTHSATVTLELVQNGEIFELSHTEPGRVTLKERHAVNLLGPAQIITTVDGHETVDEVIVTRVGGLEVYYDVTKGTI